ncbi:UPSTREAM OF FLC protein (DUF966) [Rhynchospora pubera]|uniref:UPSTREAM OF FLC protein (DUF966) n=1 Tax=Rhynchospora pubera TaxID=906938 RepID=A0AAV8GGM8_9POAL|nr:UPSTREAM OF FLC protein (DUF966) [Rhynchospora pubera]
MAVAPRKWRDRETSPERTKVWVEPKPRVSQRRVPVVYYLSRNGQLEHPHFMEVPLSSSDGLYLKDVVNRLNALRGKGMASMYAWSSKRGYKNGYVWHDLTDDDLILPAHGNEYVLKGSELLFPEISPISHEPHHSASSNFEKSLVPSRDQRRTSWGGSLDLAEYKVYKSDAATTNLAKGADAATQTEERRLPRRRSPDFAPPPPPEAELGSDDISPPPSSSSPETLETIIKSEVKITGPRNSHVATSEQLDESDPDRMVGSIASGRMRASAVLMQLISCGSIQVKDNSAGPTVQYSEKMSRGRSDLSSAKDLSRKEMDGMLGRVGFDPMDREYFSGSLVETKKKDGDERVDGFNGLKRSNSYNADRTTKLDIVENEMDTSRAKCIPRKPRNVMRREASISNPSQISRSNLGSKRISDGALS